MSWSFSQDELALLAQKFHLDLSSRRNTLLDTFMLRLRENRKMIPTSLTHTVFQSGDYVQLWVQTPPCRFSQTGKCTICNYWVGQHIDGLLGEVLSSLRLPASGRTLLINTCGSCLDTRELPEKELEQLLTWLQKQDIPRVIFETHWTTLTPSILEKIRTALPGKEVCYEIGVESTNPDVLFFSLNKSLFLSDLAPVIRHIHQYGARCIANVVFGAPFLRPEEQVKDTTDSIWNMLHMEADYIVLFPVNLKPQTLPEFLSRHGWYKPVPGKLAAEILRGFPAEALPRINIAWFGDHQEDHVLPPHYCAVCESPSKRLFSRFNAEENGEARMRLLQDICRIDCDCIPSYFSQTLPGGTAAERLDCFYTRLDDYVKKGADNDAPKGAPA